MNDKNIRALRVPYRTVTRGLSRLITVSRNCCSTALSWPSHVVPKLMIKFRGVRHAWLPGRSSMDSVALN